MGGSYMDPTGKNVRIWHFGIATIVALAEKSSPSHAVRLPTSKNTCEESTSTRNTPSNHEPNQRFLAKTPPGLFDLLSNPHKRREVANLAKFKCVLTLWTCVTRQALIVIE